jgi:predicted Zn-dependent peptidase
VRALPGSYETTASVLGVLATNQLYGRPDNYVQSLKQNIEAQTDAQVDAAAKQLFVPDALTWVVVGDLTKIEAPVRALNIGEVKVLDADGKVVR